MKKKMVAMLLAAVMVSGCLTGCGQTSQSASESKQEESKESKESKSAESSQVEEKEEEVVTVKWVFRKDPQEDQDMVEDAINEIIRERYNLELDMEFVSSGEYNDRIKLMQTSGEEFDICFTSNWANSFTENVGRDGFLALDDYMDTEGGIMLKNAVPEDIWGAATVNGKIYAVPNNQIMAYHNGVVIQKEYVDKYNIDLDSVQGIKDLYPLFEQIKENEDDVSPYYPNGGGGLPSDVVTRLYDIVNNGIVYRDDAEYKVYPYTADTSEEEWKHEMWELGYIKSDWITVTDATGELSAGMYASQTTNAKPGVEASFTSERGEEYVNVHVADPYKSMNAAAATMSAVSVTSPNPEAAVKMLGVMYTDVEVFNMLCFGIEGEHYTKLSENRVERIADSGYTGFTGWEVGDQFNAWLIPGQEDDVWEETAALNEAAEASHLDSFNFVAEPVATEIAQINSVKTEYVDIWAYENYEELREERNAKLEEAGLSKVIEEIQRQIDEWRVANGK